MSSIPALTINWSFSVHAGSATSKVDAPQLDQAHLDVVNWAGDVKTAMDYLLRSDDTLNDSIVRLRNLHPEVLARLGVAGANGVIWYSGAGVPSNGTGAQGDFYLRTSNGDIYTKGPSTWGSPIFSITVPVPSVPVAGYSAWFDANQITGLSNNDPVSTWADLSGNANNLTAAGALRPVYKTGALNGLPAVEFDGIDDSMSLAGAVLSGGAYRTIFMVVATVVEPAPSNQRMLFDARPSLGPASRRLLAFDTYTGFRVQYSNSTSAANYLAATNGESLLVAARDSVGSTLWRLNGNPARQGTIAFTPDGSPDLGTARVGSNYIGTAAFAGRICEFIVYPNTLLDTDFASVEAYLKAKYGIP